MRRIRLAKKKNRRCSLLDIPVKRLIPARGRNKSDKSAKTEQKNGTKRTLHDFSASKRVPRRTRIRPRPNPAKSLLGYL